MENSLFFQLILIKIQKKVKSNKKNINFYIAFLDFEIFCLAHF